MSGSAMALMVFSIIGLLGLMVVVAGVVRH